MGYTTVSNAILRDLISAKAKVNDIEALLGDSTFRPGAKEWRHILIQIIYSKRYMEEDNEQGYFDRQSCQ